MPYIIIGAKRIDREMRVVVKMQSKELGAGLESLIISPQAVLCWLVEVAESIGGDLTIFDDNFSTNNPPMGDLNIDGAPKKKVAIAKAWLDKAKSI